MSYNELFIILSDRKEIYIYKNIKCVISIILFNKYFIIISLKFNLEILTSKSLKFNNTKTFYLKYINNENEFKVFPTRSLLLQI